MFTSRLHTYTHRILDDIVFQCVAPEQNDANGLLAIWIDKNELDVDPYEFDYMSIPITVAVDGDSNKIYEKVVEIRGF
jgi:hypothetical protein